MSDQFPFHAALARRNPWPLLSNDVLSDFSLQSIDPWNQSAAAWWQRPLGMGVGTAPLANDMGDMGPSAWLRSVMLPTSSKGILATFPWSEDAAERELHDHTQDGTVPDAGRGILGQLDRWNVATHQGGVPWSQPSMPTDATNEPFAPSRSIPRPLHPLLRQSVMQYASAPQPERADEAAPSPQHLDSAKYWPLGAEGRTEQPNTGAYYLSPVPPALSWDSVPTSANNSAASIFAAVPSPNSWASPTAANEVQPSFADPVPEPINEPDEAQRAREAAALRQARRERAAAIERSAPRAPNPQDETNEPTFRGRTRLGFLDSYYRGTVLGAERLAYLAHLSATPDAPETRPEGRRVNDALRQEYWQITADLARYDRMRSARNPAEFGAAALGQLGGMLSPESWLGLGAKGAGRAWRAAKAGLQQGAVNTVTDPIVQGLNMYAGARDRYSPQQALVAGGIGFATGAVGRSLAEAVAPSRFYSPGYTRGEQLGINRNVGRVWEERKGDLLTREGWRDASPQITLMSPGGSPVRVDWMARHPITGDWHCFECKSSPTARLTKRQREEFPRIEKYGAAVQGAGKAPIPGGTTIPPTKIEIFLPPEE
jgi:hypothetical protein